MKIGIIGFGFVGQAIAWAHKDDELVIRDPKLPDSASLDQFTDCDGVFVCVPSPSTDSGCCDSSILEETVKELLFSVINNPIPIICKTTAPPSVYEKLHQQYPTIVYSPEFLTAANNVSDYANADYVVIGGTLEWCEKARVIMSRCLPNVQDLFIFTDIKTASLYKYIMNCYLATKVTFMNDFANFAEHIGVNWDSIRAIAAMDVRIGHTHMEVPGPDGKRGWGGMCFPKDMDAILHDAVTSGAELDLLDQVRRINNRHRAVKD